LQSQLGHTAIGAIRACSSTGSRYFFLILVTDFFQESKSGMFIIEDCLWVGCGEFLGRADRGRND